MTQVFPRYFGLTADLGEVPLFLNNGGLFVIAFVDNPLEDGSHRILIFRDEKILNEIGRLVQLNRTNRFFVNGHYVRISPLSIEQLYATLGLSLVNIMSTPEYHRLYWDRELIRQQERSYVQEAAQYWSREIDLYWDREIERYWEELM